MTEALPDRKEPVRYAAAAPYYPATSLFHLFVNPRSDPNFGSSISSCNGTLAEFAVEYVIQQQYLQVRALFDVSCILP
jgi:hypothetical protein